MNALLLYSCFTQFLGITDFADAATALTFKQQRQRTRKACVLLFRGVIYFLEFHFSHFAYFFCVCNAVFYDDFVVISINIKFTSFVFLIFNFIGLTVILHFVYAKKRNSTYLAVPTNTIDTIQQNLDSNIFLATKLRQCIEVTAVGNDNSLS